MLFSKIIKKQFDAVLGRYDGNPALCYFSPKDFPDIQVEPFSVEGDKGLLHGNFYYYGTFQPQRFVVFDHGIGAGHLAYFKEIELLAKQGYTVYAYDHTGCVKSAGEGIYGFAQGVSDLDHVLTALLQDERFKTAKIKLVGHSWGGYSVMNVAALHPEVTHVVSLAGFLSAKTLIAQYLPNFVMRYLPEVLDRERQNNPTYADLDARDSLAVSKAHFMYLQSTDDPMVDYQKNYVPLFEALHARENTEFISLTEHGHSPQWTVSAVRACAAMQKELEILTKKKKLQTKKAQADFRNAQDWTAMTEQDLAIWNRIFAFLEK